MKNPLIFIIPAVLLGLVACKKISDPMKLTAITPDESAIMIAGSLASGSNGLCSFSNDISFASQSVYTVNKGCGITHVDSVYHKNQPGAVITFDFKQKISSKLNCNSNNQPDNVTNNMSFSGSYNGPNISAKQSGTANTTVAGLTPASAVFAINGTLKTMGSFKLKADTTRNGTIAIDFTVKNLVINKATVNSPAMIASGGSAVTITGNSTKGAFLFEGTITFSGYNEALLTLGGSTYTLNLNTGAVAKK